MIQLPPYEPTVDDQQSVYDYTIPLGERTYRVVLTHRGWQRQDRWYLNLYTADNVALILGIFLAVDIPLMDDLEIEGLPDGRLFLLDTSDAGLECGFADLGNRCVLEYVTADEMADLATTPDYGITITAAP